MSDAAATDFIRRHAPSEPSRAPQEADLVEEERLLPKKFGYLLEHPDINSDLRDLMDFPLSAAGYCHALHPDDARLPGYFRTVARATLLGCRMAEAPAGTTVEGELPQGRLGLVTAGGSLVDTLDFVTGMYAAIVSRDTETAHGLAAVDLGRLTPQGVTVAPFVADWARALQLDALNDPRLTPEWESLVLRAIKGCDPDAAPDDPTERAYLAFVASPVMELRTQLTGAEAANAALRDAVEAHRTYQELPLGRPPQTNQDDPRSFIALGPLAMAVFMVDMGMPVTVQSDYLPRSLLEGFRLP